jgi:hypothetical protein
MTSAQRKINAEENTADERIPTAGPTHVPTADPTVDKALALEKEMDAADEEADNKADEKTERNIADEKKDALVRQRDFLRARSGLLPSHEDLRRVASEDSREHRFNQLHPV